MKKTFLFISIIISLSSSSVYAAQFWGVKIAAYYVTNSRFCILANADSHDNHYTEGSCAGVKGGAPQYTNMGDSTLPVFCLPRGGDFNKSLEAIFINAALTNKKLNTLHVTSYAGTGCDIVGVIEYN